MQYTTSFTASQLQAKIGPVQEAVFNEGVVLITCRNRSDDMVLMLKGSHDTLVQTAIDQQKKIKQLTDLIKAQG